MRAWQRLDPRRHVSAAVGWILVAVVMLAALAAGQLAAMEAERLAQRDAERLLGEFATQIHRTLTSALGTRESIMQATAAQIVASEDRGSEALGRHLRAVQAQFPEFIWLGVADAQGRITASTAALPEGLAADSQAWYRRGREHVFLGDVHPAPAPDDRPDQAAAPQPLRVIDIAVPIDRPDGIAVGVLGAQLSWPWIHRLQAEALASLDPRRGLELVLAAADGSVLIGPRPWLGRPLPAAAALSGGGAFLSGRHDAAKGDAASPRWTVVIRQSAAAALAPAQSARHRVFFIVLGAGLLAAVLAVLATRRSLSRLVVLSEQAQAVGRGERKDLAVPAGRDEISHIGATLAQVVAHLQGEKQALLKLNAELDARVAERTARIERLAEDARHAAVNRERLRLARDLHDTLAHSLMALLTQIRLVRKLRRRLPEHELEAELARAEEVATSGLAEARAAITQMRRNGVREMGLGAALKDLLTRFQERCGIATSLHTGPGAAGLADERAETLFRIVEEALNNVERHAQAQQVTVTLGSSDAGDTDAAMVSGRLRLQIADDGIGFDPRVPAAGHYGLAGIREQAALIDARLALDSRPGEGTRIVLTFAA
jgi:signal transduction histidine kinase